MQLSEVFNRVITRVKTYRVVSVHKKGKIQIIEQLVHCMGSLQLVDWAALQRQRLTQAALCDLLLNPDSPLFFISPDLKVCRCTFSMATCHRKKCSNGHLFLKMSNSRFRRLRSMI